MPDEIDSEKLMLLESMLNKRRWCRNCLRANIAEPHQIVIRKTVKIALLKSEVYQKRKQH